MKPKSNKCFLLCAALCGTLSAYARADVTLVRDSKSTFTIVTPTDAPKSVQNAAIELQKDVQLATGVKLPLAKDSQAMNAPIISIGNTKQAAGAGIDSNVLAYDAFHIITKNSNVYIVGMDTPDKALTPFGGTSNGSANGVYTFLEDYLNVRWLMPGDIGRDVPQKSTFILKNIDRTVTPTYNWRSLGSHLRDYSNTEQFQNVNFWKQTQRIGGSTNPNSDHSWWRTINGSPSSDVKSDAVHALYQAHPEWFAMDTAGNRPAPKNGYYKLETTDQDFVQWFANRKLQMIRDAKDPRGWIYSLSPSDGGNWSESPESKALYDPVLNNVFDMEAQAGKPGMSSLVLKWYHDVAKIIEEKAPDVRLGGYIYSQYLNPPVKLQIQLPKNFTPTLAFSPSYGYGLYRPETEEHFHHVMDSWAKVVTGDWYYYDLPNLLLRQSKTDIGPENDFHFPGTTALVSPPAAGILNTIFKSAQKDHMSGMILYSAASWSSAALHNYIMAQMMWNPTLDAKTVRNEWLHRAYGAKAGTAMEEFYNNLNTWFADYYCGKNDARYYVTFDMLQNLYMPHYAEMERLFLRAQSQHMTPVQRQRLQMIGDNLIVLQWRLRNVGLWPKNLSSELQRNDAQVNDLLVKTTADSNFNYFPGALSDVKVGWNRPKSYTWKVQLAQNADSASATKSTFNGIDASDVLLYATRDGDITIKPVLVKQGQYFAAYNVKDEMNQTRQTGFLYNGQNVVIPAKTGETYILHLIPRKPVNYKLLVQHAVVAESTFDGKTLHLSGDAPVLVYTAPTETPVGIVQEGDAVAIRKPFSAAMAKEKLVRSGIWRDVQIIGSYDEDWRFSPDPNNDGKKRGVLKADFNDSKWAKISALNWWQYQGFPDYRGAAWYRYSFDLDTIPQGEQRALMTFGAIDGDAVVYVNGKLAHERKLGSNGEGWDRAFTTKVTRFLKKGKNVIAVKVTSKPMGSSGIYKGVSLLTATQVKK